MIRTLLLAAAATALFPAMASATPGGSTNSSSQSSGPDTTGQPNQSCQDLVASGEGAYPGNSADSPGAPFNEVDGTAGSKYAGSQPQNSNNPASVSQYDVACSNQPG